MNLYSPKQMAFALWQAEGATAVPEVCRRMRTSEQTSIDEEVSMQAWALN